MANSEIVFRGAHSFTFDLPPTAEVEKENYETVDVPGFEAVCAFDRLDQLQATDEPAFTWAQAVCVTEIEDWDFRGGEFASVLALPEAVRWILCFPVVCEDGVDYAPATSEILPDGDDVFYTFSIVVSDLPSPGPVRAVPDLDSLKFLTPASGAKLVLIRAKDWEWDEKRETVLIKCQDALEVEIVSDSRVSVL